jgi:hypothetical protein
VSFSDLTPSDPGWRFLPFSDGLFEKGPLECMEASEIRCNRQPVFKQRPPYSGAVVDCLGEVVLYHLSGHNGPLQSIQVGSQWVAATIARQPGVFVWQLDQDARMHLFNEAPLHNGLLQFRGFPSSG